MNFPFLILPKIINRKGLKLFEFRQLQHLLEILFYRASDFESIKVQKNLGFAWFWRFGDGLAKTGQTLQTSSSLQLGMFPKFTNRKKRYLAGDPLDFTEKAQLVCEI
jgi:hypothetical protein